MKDTPEIEALIALEEIVEKAANKRYPVDNNTIQKAQEKFETLSEKETPISDSVIEDIQNDLQKLHRMTDGAPRTSVDHMSVQTNMVDKFNSELIEHDLFD